MATTPPPGGESGTAAAETVRLMGYGRWAKAVVRRLVRLARDEWGIWLGLGGVLVVTSVAFLTPGTPEEQAAVVGALLQLCGILTVAWGLHESRKLFNRESLLSRLRGAFRRPRQYEVSLEAGVYAHDGVDASTRVRSPEVATVEERLAALERRVDEAEAAIRQAEDRAREGEAELRKALSKEASDRAREDQEIREHIETAVIGGLRVEQAGLIWLLFGVVFASFPSWAAGLLPPVWIPALIRLVRVSLGA